MATLPDSVTVLNEVQEKLSNASQPTKTYYVDPISNQINGYCDGLTAVKQSFNFAMETQRYEYLCFTGQYGMDFRNLIGNTDDYIISETLSRVKDTFLNDNRIKSVELNQNNPFVIEGDSIIINITVETIFGNFDTTLEVQK